MTTITQKQAAAIAEAAMDRLDSFGNLPVYAVEHAAEDAGFACDDPIDATDARSKTALTTYIMRNARDL